VEKVEKIKNQSKFIIKLGKWIFIKNVILRFETRFKFLREANFFLI